MKRTVNKFQYLVIFFFFLGPIYSFPLLADEFHYNNFSVGERPSGMGGAYTALSNDATGLYYNPAGIVGGSDQVTASIYAYAKSTTEYKKVFGNTNWTSDNSEFIPGFFGFTHSLPLGTVGLSVAIVDSSKVNQNQDLNGIIVDGTTRWEGGRINYNHENRIYNIGPSYGLRLSDEFSLGTTLYVHYKKLRKDQNQIFASGGGSDYELLWENVRIEETEWGLRPIVGILWKPRNTTVSWGLTLSRTFLLSSEYSYQYVGTYQLTSPSGSRNSAYATAEKTSDLREYPYVITLGMANSFSPRWLLSWDLSYYSPTSRQDRNDPPSTFSTRGFFNTALGAEFKYSDRWIFRGGVFSNLSNNSIDDLPINTRAESIDLYGGSLSVTHRVRTASFTLGTSYSTGSGKARLGEFGFGDSRFNGQNIDAQSSIWSVFFSATF